MRTLFISLLLISVGFLTHSAYGQENLRVLRVSASDTVRVVPDFAVVSFSIVSRAQDPNAARLHNEYVGASALNSLRAFGIDERMIQVVSVRVNEETETRDGQRVRVGFQASRIISVRVANLEDLPEIVSLVFENGATQLSGVSYDVRDRKSLEDEALRRAMVRARERAEVMAGEGGVRITGIHQVTEGGFRDHTSLHSVTVSAGGRPVDAYAPGEIIVSSSVSVMYTIE